MSIQQTSQVKKSTFGQKNTTNSNGLANGGGRKMSGESSPERKTSHYAYTLETDAEGNLVKSSETGKPVKQFISSDVLQVYENEFNIALNVLGPLPTGKIYLAKHKAKA